PAAIGRRRAADSSPCPGSDPGATDTSACALSAIRTSSSPPISGRRRLLAISPRVGARAGGRRGQRSGRRPAPGGPILTPWPGRTTRRLTDERIATHKTRRTRIPAVIALDDTPTTVTALNLPNSSAPVYSTVCDTALGPVLL